MAMTPEAKRLLNTTIRGLRDWLLERLRGDVESTYRLAVRPHNAGLSESTRERRRRLETWLGEQVRAQGDGPRRDRDDFLREAEKQAAYTLLNRLVILRLLEHARLRAPEVVTHGWNSAAYGDFRQLAPALARDDQSEGYAFLLRLVFEDLAVELPGIFGSAGVADLVPVLAPTLRPVVEALDDPGLESCWSDDMTLGWVYQYWNDPEREALDAKINRGGKIERHEIASKTQMFTERYMVDWLLQNSLGPMWLAMCRKHGWTPEVVADGTLARLEERRAEWRRRRDAGDVSLTALMPLHTDAERRWAYYVEQPIPDDAVDHAPASVRDLKILDPAVGSGHFLVVAFDLLHALYHEEARHRGEAGAEPWTERAIVERILEHNLHGIDIDPRAVQIAAAALWLKARQTCPDAHPRRMNLVASNLRLASLPDSDPALVELRREVERETGIPGTLTDAIVHALHGADHLGSLLKIDAAVEEAIERHEQAQAQRGRAEQGDLFRGHKPRQELLVLDRAEVRASVIDRIETFLRRHTSGDDLGLRLRGEQLAAGVRFVRMVREGTYDLVVANPPYQGTAKMKDAVYLREKYPRGKADLYAAFLVRGLEFVCDGGVSAMLTMRNWMFMRQYHEFRSWILERYDIRALGDFAVGAFDEVPNDVLSVVASVWHQTPPRPDKSIALQPTPPDDRSYDRERTARKRSATLAQRKAFGFLVAHIRAVEGLPLLYWWSMDDLSRYLQAEHVGTVCPARFGLTTGSNERFCVRAWEPPSASIGCSPGHNRWVPFILGAKGLEWFDPFSYGIRWSLNGGEVKIKSEYQYGTVSKQIRNEEFYFRRGLSFAAIGNEFSVRAHRVPGVFSNTGLSLFPDDLAGPLTSLNTTKSRSIINDLAPGIRFDVGDVNRLPLYTIPDADAVFRRLDTEFSAHESHREPSVEFRSPGPSHWRHAQEWAQVAVDRPQGAPLPPYTPEYDPEPPTDHVSFALGVALGRFGASGEGILDPATADLSHALPGGILFLDGTLDPSDLRDSLGKPASQPLLEAWRTHGPSIDAKADLRSWLRTKFFAVHKSERMYDNRPIHWPLSSANKTFVAWINIHRMNGATLRLLLADHLRPTLTRLEGELTDIRAAREGADRKAARAAERRFTDVKLWRDELDAFVRAVTDCAEKGPAPADASSRPREVDARYEPDLDDGVMINSAALWPLLEPQWKNPKTWWKELSSPKDKKDYDWAHLAMRYWPTRVDEKCRKDPSLGVAHGCFWKYHPARAWAWELRLQDEIGPEFRITEAPYRGDGGDGAHRAAWLRDHVDEALEAVEKEALRRLRKRRAVQPTMRLLEAGLWSARPSACWAMELRVSEKQGAEFRLLAPDEPAARAAFERAYPQEVARREQLLKRLVPVATLFGDATESDDGQASEIEEDESEGEQE